jgi:hypothetical protein
VYGCGERSNNSGQRETVRDPDAEISIFDDACFMFYVIKYSEILGLEALIAVLDHNQITYHQKIKIIDFITKIEVDLGVMESSWRHCLLYVFFNGGVSQDDFNE